MVPVQALSFDLDETLLDGSRLQETIRQTCTELAKETRLDANQIFEANSKAWNNYWPEVEQQWTLGRISGAEVSLEVWRRTLLTCGRDDESLSKLALANHSRHRRNALRLFDDVKPALDVIKPRFRLALITNGASDTQRGALRLLGIKQVFDSVVISGEVGVAKPDPSVFAHALKELGVKKEAVWHVGDSLRTDVAGALHAGLTAVWLNRAGVRREDRDPKPHLEIQSLSELARLVLPTTQNKPLFIG
jgi:putative hydrolase of the HAD superfamily